MRRFLLPARRPSCRASDRPAVAVVIDAVYPWHKGGKEVRCHQLLAHSTSGLDATVYTMAWWQQGRAWRGLLASETSVDGIRHVSLCPKVDLYAGRRRSLIQAGVFAAGCLRMLSRRFDVIEADHMPLPQLIPLRVVAWLRRVPLVVTWHEVWAEELWCDYVGRRAGRFAAALERRLALLGDVVVAAGPGTARRLTELGVPPENVFVVPAGVGDDHLTVVADPAAPQVLYSGRLVDHKRVDLLLDALAVLARRGVCPSVLVLGDGPERERLVEQASRLKLDHVTFSLPLDSRDTLFSLMAGASVFVSPSEREGFGMTVLEAGLLGTAVVTSDAPANESQFLVHDGLSGSVVPAGDPDALADAVERWLVPYDRAAVQAAVDPERRYRWAGVAATYQAAIDQALNRRH